MKNYVPLKLSKFMEYLDKNNLYVWGRSGYLLNREFKGLENSDSFDIKSINEKNLIGCILNVDVECPDKLYQLCNDYLLAPEELAIPYDMLWQTCCDTIPYDRCKKLVMGMK